MDLCNIDFDFFDLSWTSCRTITVVQLLAVMKPLCMMHKQMLWIFILQFFHFTDHISYIRTYSLWWLADLPRTFVGDITAVDALVQGYHSAISSKGSKVQCILMQMFSEPHSSARILVATAGFRIGVDIQDICWVVHKGACNTIVRYGQEVGLRKMANELTPSWWQHQPGLHRWCVWKVRNHILNHNL